MTINFKINTAETVSRMGVEFTTQVVGNTINLIHAGKEVTSILVEKSGRQFRSKGGDFYKVSKHIQQQGERAQVSVTFAEAAPVAPAASFASRISAEDVDAAAAMSEIQSR